MPTIIERFPPLIDVSSGDLTAVPPGLQAARPVRGFGQWHQYAQAIAWAVARGGTLVTAGPSGAVAAGASSTWRFYTWPRIPIVARLWCIGLSMRETDADDYHATGTFEIPDGAAGQDFAINARSRGRVTMLKYDEPISETDAPAEVLITMNVASSSGGSVYVEYISCYEISRASMVEFGAGPEPAPNVVSNESGRIISEGNAAGLSVDGVMRTVMDPDATIAQIRRSCYFSDYRPTGQVVGTSPELLFLAPFYALPRVNTLDGGTQLVKVAVYGSGPTGSKAIVAGGLATVDIVLPTSNGWAFGDVELDCETPETWDTAGGAPGGGVPQIEVYGQRVGAGTCTIYGVCMGDPPP